MKTSERIIKVTYIISNIDKAPFFENTFKLIDKNRFEVSAILLNPEESKLEETLVAEGIYYKRIRYRGKKDYIRALFNCFSLLRRMKPDVVHAHLLDAGLIGLSASLLAGVKNRIYTRHGGSQRFFLKKGVKYDKATNFLSTHIVATCGNGKEILTEAEHVPSKKVTVITYAVDVDRFVHLDQNNVKRLKEIYDSNNRGPVIGVIARWDEGKGIQYIIPAFRKFLDVYPDALLILANTAGSFTQEILKLLKPFSPDEIRCIRFEENIYELYQLFDLFVHVPIEKQYEGFGQTYIEALAAGIPSVFTMAGVAPEFITHDYNALVVDFKNSGQIFEALNILWTDPGLRQKLIENGRTSVQGKFEFKKYINDTEILYTSKYKSGK